MQITISRVDNFVSVDDLSCKVDCTELHGLVNFVRWSGDAPDTGDGWEKRGTGELQFFSDHKGAHLPNLPIADFSPYSHLYEKWAAVKADQDKLAVADAAAKQNGPAALAAVTAQASGVAPAAAAPKN